jgi:ATP-dependent RNA helicase DDX24/MAK5
MGEVITITKTKTNTNQRNKLSKRNKKKIPLEGGLAEILEKTHAMGQTKVVDLSMSSRQTHETNQSKSSTNPSSSSPSSSVQLPPGLRLEQILCTQRHKDSHLYAYLMTTTQGSSGPALVFCNSIAAVRRVGTTLQTLGLTVRILHAHMQQVRSLDTS